MSKITKIDTLVNQDGEIEIYVTKMYNLKEFKKGLDFVDCPNNPHVNPFYYNTGVPKLRGDKITCDENERWNTIVRVAKEQWKG